jgi:tetratricopeptide (TPR) repeat protein
MCTEEPETTDVTYAAQRGCAAAFFLFCLLVFPVASLQAQPGGESLSPTEYTAILNQGRQLVIENRMQDAYNLLIPHELALAGNPDYDYLLGTAAVDSGHTSLAIFALERVLEKKPAFAGARLELARAYFDSGDAESARYHFDYLKGQNPPPNVQQAITSYLRAIDRVAAAYKPIHLPHFAAGFGWDSNANASTAVEQFLGFVLDGEKRNYPDASFVNSTDVGGNAALEWSFGDTRIAPSVAAARNWLDGDDNLDRYTGDLAISHSLNDDWKLLAGVTAATHRFSDELEIQDVNVYNGRIGFEHYLDPASGSVISAMAMVGADSARERESPFDNDRWALVVRGSRLVMPGLLLSLDAGARNTEFDGLFFGEQREDKQFNAALSLHMFDWPAQGWRVIGRVGYTDVDSDLDLYTYDRTEVGLTFHRSFE